MANRREYAQRYDAMAQKLYQIAVYLTGDAFEARRAIAAAFVAGYDAAAKGETPFAELMLDQLFRSCADCPVLSGEEYCRRLAETLAPAKADERLCTLLCDLEPWQRSVILLAFLAECRLRESFSWSDSSHEETVAVLRGLFLRVKKECAAQHC